MIASSQIKSMTAGKGNNEMEMYDPAHPGEIVREECLKPLGLTVTAAAEALGVIRKA